jgi:hypothetical protein
MTFKLLNNVLPLEIVKEIYEYDNTYKLSMNNVMKQIEKLNNAIEEYWHMDEIMYYMTEREESYRLKMGLPISVGEHPLPKKKCFRFWNTLHYPTLEEITPPRDHWMFYQYEYDGCFIYPTSPNT